MPIADQLRPRLERALRESPGPLVFPKPDGTMHSRKLRLNRMLRAAIARAGLIEGYEHRCGAAHCGWKEQRPSPALPDACPRCGKLSLWARPIPRHVRFHDTRHSGGTAVVRSAGMAVAQKFLRHSDVRLTIHTNGHLDVEDVREGLSRSFATGPVPVRTAGGLRDGTEWVGSEQLRTDGTARDESRSPVASNDSGGGPARTRARRARSAASARSGLGEIARVSPECTERQAVDFVGAADPPESHAPHAGVPSLDAWTAAGLRAGLLPLPPASAELFIQAGAIAAERAVRSAGGRVEVESILRRASDQAALLLLSAQPTGAHP